MIFEVSFARPGWRWISCYTGIGNCALRSCSTTGRVSPTAFSGILHVLHRMRTLRREKDLSGRLLECTPAVEALEAVDAFRSEYNC